MIISTVVQAHKNPSFVNQNIKMVKKNVGQNVICMIDSANWKEFENEKMECETLCGYYHNDKRNPYKNFAHGMNQLYKRFPESEWFCNSEFDVFFKNDNFKEDLERFRKEHNAGLVGFNLRIAPFDCPFINSLFKRKFDVGYYLIGCCMFFHKSYMNKLINVNFFERFLNYTAPFTSSYLPCEEYDISEHLYPSLAASLNEPVMSFENAESSVFGKGKYFVRFKPEVTKEVVDDDKYSIIHPYKNVK